MGSYAFDFSGDPADMNRFAQFIKDHLAGQTLQLIHQDAATGQEFGIAGAQSVGGPGQPEYYNTPGGSYGDERNMVHWATDVAPFINPQNMNGGAPGARPGMSPGQPGASASTSGFVSPSGTNWDRVAQGESSGNWSINTGNGYQGGLQFAPSTWIQYGGTEFAPSANLATPDQQKTVAERALSGWNGIPGVPSSFMVSNWAGKGLSPNASGAAYHPQQQPSATATCTPSTTTAESTDTT